MLGDEGEELFNLLPYEAMDRISNLHESFHNQIIQHGFYDVFASDEFKDLINEIDERLAEAYQLAGMAYIELNGFDKQND